MPCLRPFFLLLLLCFCCSTGMAAEHAQTQPDFRGKPMDFSEDAMISDVMGDPAFEGYGRLLFPMDHRYYSGRTLRELRLAWYGPLNARKSAEIVSTLKNQAMQQQIFYRFYDDDEIRRDPRKADTGLFFFRGRPDEKTVICCAGGGFAFVGAMHDSFPHALELSRMGYNAFALIYRPGAKTACEDLARAIAFLFRNAEALAITPSEYSLWGGSAGARMAAWVGTHGTEAFGEKRYPRPAAIIMQYTGLQEVTGLEPPTYSCVGTSDGIAPWRVMEQRTRALRASGIDAEIDVFPGLSHGFGLGEGTIAEGWIGRAVDFWEAHCKKKSIME